MRAGRAVHAGAFLIAVGCGSSWDLRGRPTAPNPVGSLPAPTYAQTVLADVPFAYWRLGESGPPVGNPAQDATGNGHAGTYQLTPLKSVCLSHCRSPFDFVLNHWRAGTAGALRMGMEHGLYCLGCCWFLMALLFAAGIMSLLWMAAITLYVFVEKLFPAGQWIAWISGVAMLGFGIYLICQA